MITYLLSERFERKEKGSYEWIISYGVSIHSPQFVCIKVELVQVAMLNVRGVNDVSSSFLSVLVAILNQEAASGLGWAPAILGV